MATDLSQPVLTPKECLAAERAASRRHEYWNGSVVAMAGASRNHVVIAGNISRYLGLALEDANCIVLSSDMRVRPNDQTYVYPDVVVCCEEQRFEDEYEDSLETPRIIFEVLSDSTEKIDRGRRFHLYRSIPTLTDYILVSKQRAFIEHYRRESDHWTLKTAFEQSEDPGQTSQLVFDDLGVSLALSDIYRNVNFPDPPTDEELQAELLG